MFTPAAPRPSPLGDQAGLLGRAGHALLHWWPSRPAPTPSTRQVQLLALVSLLDEAVQAQSAADGAMAACGEPGPVPASALHEAGQQNSIYRRLMVRLRGLRVDDELTGLQEHASRLLSHHEWLLHQAVNLASSPSTDRVEAARLRLNGLGAPASELRELCDEVQTMAKRAGSEETSP
ncbi:hypothetical protein [Streptomyces sp. NPDC005283]|uniref:hypothetical protein n=1 Tax=Streptomyces sp. NPDC005283 TaxID=3156871 RepID=UPI00345347AE